MPELNFGPRLERYACRKLAEDRRINLLEGSVRSGKTWAHHAKIIRGCKYDVGGWRILTGVTKDTVYNNVLNDLFNLVGPENYFYNKQSGYLRLLGADWRVIGAKDEGSEKFIRGLTAGIVVSDEVTLMPKEFFQMLLTRMSPDGARFYGSTNADSPLHWLKTDYLDNQELRDRGDLFSMHCTMADNPNLSEEYKASQERFYKGLFYLRYIKGLWVMAEGVIYRDVWDDKRCTFEDADLPQGLRGPGGTKERTITIDYGTVNPFVALDVRDDGTTCWFDDEYRWDSKLRMQQKTDAQYADDLEVFVKGDRTPQFLVDPSAASMKAELVQRGFWVSNAKNEVLEGIKKTSTALANGVLRFHRKRCKETINEFQTYSWDPKKAMRGLEEPIKSGDHGPDAGRYYVESNLPDWRLM